MASNNLRYDWYQTDSHVVITILQKNVQTEHFTKNFQEQNIEVSIKSADGDSVSNLSLHLAHPITPENSTYKIMSTKVELKLQKKEATFWNKLEGEDKLGDLKKPEASAESSDSSKTAQADSKVYPSSSRHPKDWDKIVHDVDQDKEEDGDALNNLFQKIYADGNDETKKAMMKSFMESSGTVLSTNWEDIKKDKVDVKPPDGMEYKKYE